MKKLIIFFIAAHIIVYSNNCNGQWVQYPINTGTVWSYTTAGSYIFAGSDSGIFRTSDNGESWGLNYHNNYHFLAVASNSSVVFASPHSNKIIYTTNFGTNWVQTSIGAIAAQCLAINGSNVFAGFLNIGVYRSTDNGINWFQTSLNDKSIVTIAIKGSRIFAGTSGQGVFSSTDNGGTWGQTTLNNLSVNSLAFKDTILFAGTVTNGVYYSTNYGLNWVQSSLNNHTVFSVAVKDSIIFAGTYDYGVYISKNNGTNWIQKNQGFYTLTPSISSLHIKDNYVFAGQYNYVPNAGYKCIYRRSLFEVIRIKETSSIVTDRFLLEQNYPNPFNPSTVIRFQIKDSRFTTLKVHDILGKEVATLVNENLKAGTYEVTFDGAGLSSGIYFYKLEANNFTEIKKAVLIK